MSRATAGMTAARSRASDVPACRARDFPILATRVRGEAPLVYLDNAATTQKPQAVIDATSRYYARGEREHPSRRSLAERAGDRGVRPRAGDGARAFLGAEHAHEIIFTRGTTEAINLVASSFGEAFVERRR